VTLFWVMNMSLEDIAKVLEEESGRSHYPGSIS
jgi:hypothetical protein